MRLQKKVGTFRSQASNANLDVPLWALQSLWALIFRSACYSPSSSCTRAMWPRLPGKCKASGWGLLGGKEKVSPAVLTCPPIPVRFEKLAQDRKKQLEILQLAQAQGLDPPGHHFELKTFQTVRCQSLRETVAPCRDRTRDWRLRPL